MALLRKSSLDQLKRLRKDINKQNGGDIGDKSTKGEGKIANILYIDNPIDREQSTINQHIHLETENMITSFTDFVNEGKKWGTYNVTDTQVNKILKKIMSNRYVDEASTKKEICNFIGKESKSMNADFSNETIKKVYNYITKEINAYNEKVNNFSENQTFESKKEPVGFNMCEKPDASPQDIMRDMNNIKNWSTWQVFKILHK